MPGLRVAFGIDERVEETGVRRIVGAQLIFAALGSGAAPVAALDKKACTLRFGGRYLERAREGSAEAFEPFAEFSGLLTFVGTRPEFSFVPTTTLTQLKPNTLPGQPRSLQLDFDAATFRAIPDTASELRTLNLPDVPDAKKEFRHFELGVALLLEGDPVADFDTNAVLDVPLTPVPAGLVLEWPADLDAFVPAGLTFIAKQADIERQVRWTQGFVTEGRRQFLFRGIAGAGAVDLTVAFQGRRVALWEAQDVSDPATPPAWKTTLEAELGRPTPGEPGEFQNQRAMPSNEIASRTSEAVLPL